VDITTGEFFATQLANAERELRGALASIAPGEIITNNPSAIARSNRSFVISLFPI